MDTTSTLSGELQVYLERKFLARAMQALVMKEGGQSQVHKSGNGKSITFNRYNPLTQPLTALTEGNNPAVENISGAQVTVNLAEYGKTIKMSRFLSLTSIDRGNKEKIELLGQNMGETCDSITREAIYAGATVQLANGSGTLADVGGTDIFNTAEVKKAVRTLEANRALPYADGFYMGKVQPRTKYDLISDATWVNAKTYSDVKDLYKGEMGELFGVRFLLSTNHKSESNGHATVPETVYSNFIHGKDSFGYYDLEGDVPQLFIVPNKPDSNNPAARYSLASWAGSYAAKVLNGNWVVNVKAGASA